ncbi:MAG: TraB/GumN family protein [Dehalococcoidia bacterium]|nr:TraB/GumN family protein [Dehalococcoidia bacterium]
MDDIEGRTKKVVIIGTGHVFNLRGKVRTIIHDVEPQAVCVELDDGRYEALFHGRGRSFHPLALLQALMATIYGTVPGNDMLGGIEGARDIGAELFLIDKDIRVIKRGLRQAFISEILNPVEIARKLVRFPPIALSRPRAMLNFEDSVKEFEKDPERYRDLLGKSFPRIRKVLLDDRERYMAIRVKGILERFDDIAIVTGAGHVIGLRGLLSDYDIRVFSLTTLLGG